MARTPKERQVSHPPLFSIFKPAGISGEKLKTEILELDEYEAIRLADYLGLEHEKAAEAMLISRSTFSRLIERARKKVALMLVEGYKIQIKGGSVHFRENIYRCEQCHFLLRCEMNQGITTACPQCGSEKLMNFADYFGHGKCCSSVDKGKNK